MANPIQGYFDSTSFTLDVNGFPIWNRAVGSTFMAKFAHTALGNGAAAVTTGGFQVVKKTGMTVTVKPYFICKDGYMMYQTAETDIMFTSSTSEQVFYIGARLDVANNHFDGDDVGAFTTFVSATDLVSAVLTIPANAVAITDGMIDDKRYNATYCGQIDEYRERSLALIEELETQLAIVVAGGIPSHAGTHASGGDDPIPYVSYAEQSLSDSQKSQSRINIGASSADGWVSASETWTYASASTITVPSGAASKYSIGDSIRWKQGGAYKYGVISAVADTLLTIIVNTDYTVANSAITDNYYTHSATAIGLPAYYNFTPSFSNLTAGSGSNMGRYRTDGRKIEVNILWTFGSGAAIGVDPKVNFPVVASSSVVYAGSTAYFDSSTVATVFGNIRTDGYLKYFAVSGSVVAVGFPSSTAPFTWETNDTIALSIVYSF